MSRFIESVSDRDDAETIFSIVRLGLEHEMQHQELLVYDIKHLLCDQFDAPIKDAPRSIENVSGMVEIEGGLFELGVRSPTVREGSTSESGVKPPHSKDFTWDNEKPAHKVFLEDFSIDRAPVSNCEYLEFINDGGYQ